MAAQTGGYPFYLVPGEAYRKMYEVIKAVIQVYQSRAQKIGIFGDDLTEIPSGQEGYPAW